MRIALISTRFKSYFWDWYYFCLIVYTHFWVFTISFFISIRAVYVVLEEMRRVYLLTILFIIPTYLHLLYLFFLLFLNCFEKNCVYVHTYICVHGDIEICTRQNQMQNEIQSKKKKKIRKRAQRIEK